jgi:hypothetical protein
MKKEFKHTIISDNNMSIYISLKALNICSLVVNSLYSRIVGNTQIFNNFKIYLN